MHVVIIANRPAASSVIEKESIRSADWVIAADGGAGQCRSLGLTPDLVVGDLDSIDDATRRHYASAGVLFDRHPPEKDQTDLELAVAAAVEKGADRISILCAMGGRWDMSLANALMLFSEHLGAVSIRLIDGQQEIRAIRGPAEVRLSGHPGQRVSLIPVGAAEGITLSGLGYPLDHESLPIGSARGVSNHFTSSSATVRLEKGMVLCVIDHGKGP